MAGETANEPAHVSGTEEAVALAARAPCRCGAPLQGVAPVLDEVRLGDSLVGVVKLGCPRCGAARIFYCVRG